MLFISFISQFNAFFAPGFFSFDHGLEYDSGMCLEFFRLWSTHRLPAPYIPLSNASGRVTTVGFTKGLKLNFIRAQRWKKHSRARINDNENISWPVEVMAIQENRKNTISTVRTNNYSKFDQQRLVEAFWNLGNNQSMDDAPSPLLLRPAYLKNPG